MIMRTIVIGYGYMGQIRRQVIDALPELELVGICDEYLSVEEADIGCAHFTSYKEAISTMQPDIVFVCTPNRFSPDICVYALEHNCHIFCEKPPGRTVGDIKKIIAAERAASNCKVMFGFNHRHHPAIIEAKSIVDAGRMGKILWLRGIYGKSGGDRREFEASWRNNAALSGGGILLDQGIHMLDLFRFFCGDFDEVRGFLSTCYWDVGVEDNAFVMLRNQDGQSAQLHSSATLWKHTFRLDIGLEDGYLVAEGLLSKSGSYGRETLIVGRKGNKISVAAVGNPREEVAYFDRDLSWELQVRDLVRCIATDEPVVDSSTQDALRVMEIIDSVYEGEGLSYKSAPERCEGEGI
jgi:predicted dehydrogenase